MNREIDAEIAERIFGWTNVAPDCYVHDGKDWCGTDPSGTGGYYGTGRKIVPHYSTDIARAWEVWTKVRTLPRSKLSYFWTTLRGLVSLRIGQDYRITDATAALFMEPEDICKAALEVHGVRTMPDWYYEG